MKTVRLRVDAQAPGSSESAASIAQAAEILRRGGTVAFPTETVYGLGANALRAEAVAKIFAAKQRPSWDPLIVHVDGPEMLARVAAEVPGSARRLIDAFWPGPLTLLLPRHAGIPDAVTAGRPRVGVRMPQHPVAHALIRAAGLPLAAPSANTFGRTSPTLAEHVLQDLDGRIDAILDSGETTHGLESTVIDVCEEPCIVYRPGVITLEQIQAVIPSAVMFFEAATVQAAEPASLPSPGVGIRHYAPRARLVLVQGEGESQKRAFLDAVRQAEASHERVGLMLPDAFESAAIGESAAVWRWGKWSDAGELAQRLFAGLRWLDGAGASVIVCPLPPAQGIGAAIGDRLRKAARSS
ncbi:L-threonylcarbamoyladenylate synthase [Paracidobacterium acidisoli]|uniref:Threonylcarbamoyl-AMP synthase n=1 Tax=Paracidobacterium acidisoli TaxID=2303751 RepID=A0A372ITX4_9BACT|nr:L-threonylcarbamoyladenylate synthase [Paracidobacterium acidisoli]MBT9329819.1 threonylcarbamoyl-AMP synthase [Paracidobacterium acidisoli]